jgi:pimeloyl-ACP methyl ester carboxylesterase
VEILVDFSYLFDHWRTSMNVYFISGMGADGRLFKHIRLPEGFQMHFVQWITPEEEDTIPTYASRLLQQVDTTQPFALVGVSLGGIMAVEIAKISSPVATVIIGSIPVAAHLPRYYVTLGRRLGLLRVLPGSFFKGAASLKRWLTSETAEDRKLVWQMIDEADGDFLLWAMRAVLKWENKELPQPLWHIHGARDIVFPIMLTRPSHIIRKGGHLFIMTHAEQVNGILQDILAGPGGKLMAG